MNVLLPIIVVIVGAAGVWFVRSINSPKPFEYAIIGIVILVLLWWLLVTFGGYDGLYLRRG